MTTRANLGDFPSLVRKVAAALAGDEATRPAPGRFALVEHVWHLRDLEIEGFQLRIDRLRAEREPRLADFDGDRAAKARDYLALPFLTALAELAAARRDTIRKLGAIRGAAWLRSGTQDGIGRVVLSELPSRILEHDRAHAEELVELVHALRPRAPIRAELRDWIARVPPPRRSPCSKVGTQASAARALSLTRVQAAIVARIEGTPSLDTVSRGLGVSRRTLQRHLAERGLTLRCLVDETRQALALEKVSAGTPAPRAAIELGFADVRAFLRAFKRWTHTTPRAFE